MPRRRTRHVAGTCSVVRKRQRERERDRSPRRRSRSKDATNGAKGIATNGARTLLGFLAVLLGAFLLVTRSFLGIRWLRIMLERDGGRKHPRSIVMRSDLGADSWHATQAAHPGGDVGDDSMEDSVWPPVLFCCSESLQNREKTSNTTYTRMKSMNHKPHKARAPARASPDGWPSRNPLTAPFPRSCFHRSPGHHLYLAPWRSVTRN